MHDSNHTRETDDKARFPCADAGQTGFQGDGGFSVQAMHCVGAPCDYDCHPAGTRRDEPRARGARPVADRHAEAGSARA